MHTSHPRRYASAVWGVDVPEAIECFADVAGRMDIAPNEVWVCCGSGTLIRGLQKDWKLRKVKKNDYYIQ